MHGGGGGGEIPAAFQKEKPNLLSCNSFTLAFQGEFGSRHPKDALKISKHAAPQAGTGPAGLTAGAHLPLPIFYMSLRVEVAQVRGCSCRLGASLLHLPAAPAI